MGLEVKSVLSHIMCFLFGALLAYLYIALATEERKKLVDITSRGNSDRRMLESWSAKAAKSSPLQSSKYAVVTAVEDAAPLDKMIIVAHSTEDESWVDVFFGDIPHVVYQPGNNDTLRPLPSEKGREALVYLTYIVENYHNLPQSMLFVHAGRGEWHIQDKVPIIQRLRWGELGYGNLRYKGVQWDCGVKLLDGTFMDLTCGWQGLFLRPTRPQAIAASTSNDPVRQMLVRDATLDSEHLAQFWNATFARELGPLPETIHAPCCAEFVVSRERVLSHPREFYQGLLDWVVSNPLDSVHTGRLFEQTWHMIFGEPAVMEALHQCELMRCDGSVTRR